jgi:hypothetical protein
MCILMTIILIHFIYYFKLDIFNMLKSKQTIKPVIKDFTNEHSLLNHSINELKTLNECIHNGKIDTAFS